MGWFFREYRNRKLHGLNITQNWLAECLLNQFWDVWKILHVLI